VTFDPGPFLRRGDHFRLMNPRDLWGQPHMAGRFEGAPLTIGFSGDFAAFVLLNDSHAQAQ
jgi:hypothetical protein